MSIIREAKLLKVRILIARDIAIEKLRDEYRKVRRWITRRRLRISEFASNYWKELLLSTGVLLGWSFVTIALVKATGWTWVFYLMIGLLLLLLCGIRYLSQLFWEGLYHLSNEG